MSAGAFSKIAGARVSGGGNHIRDGIYKLMVEKAFIQQGHKGETFIAEFRVMESTPSSEVDAQGRPIQPNPVGSSCSFVAVLSTDSGPGNAKAFMIGALGGLGYTEEQVTPDLMGALCGSDNQMRGLVLADETYRVVNKGRSNPANKGQILTLNKWKPIAQTIDQVKAARAWLDSNPAREVAASQVAAVQAPAPNLFAPAAAPAAAPRTGGALDNILGLK
jgi:hypothetical protein